MLNLNPAKYFKILKKKLANKLKPERVPGSPYKDGDLNAVRGGWEDALGNELILAAWS